MDTPTTQSARPAFSLAEGAFLIVVPLAWAVLLWFHPPVAPVYGSLRDQVVT